MKNRLIKSAIATLLIAVLFASCDPGYSNESNCPVIVSVPTAAVTGPSAAAVNEEISFNVSYRSRANCSDFSTFHKQILVNQRIITPTVVYDACACTDSTVTTRTEVFKFKEAAAGVYELKFRKENDDYINHTVTVGEAPVN